MDRFYSKTKLSDSGCLEWLGAKTGTMGYGQFYFGKPMAAHRVAWILNNGEIPEGNCVLHKCDNPLCVNIEHLFLGTINDNNQDKIRKGRAKYLRGKNNPMYRNREAAAKGINAPAAKLNPEKVSEIVELLLAGISQRKIAAQYGVTQRIIGRIKNGEIWIEATQSLPAYRALLAATPAPKGGE